MEFDRDAEELEKAEDILITLSSECILRMGLKLENYLDDIKTAVKVIVETYGSSILVMNPGLLAASIATTVCRAKTGQPLTSIAREAGRIMGVSPSSVRKRVRKIEMLLSQREARKSER